MENREGSSVVGIQGTASASQTQNPCDDSLVFPKDFVIEREDTPILDGVREGSGEVFYRATTHPDWSAFILRGEWVDDELHGKATLYHNTHPLFTANFVYGTMYFKGIRCDDGIVISQSGCKPIRSKKVVSAKPTTVTTVFPSKTERTEAKPVVVTSPSEIAEETSEKEVEEYSDYEYSDEDDYYVDDVTVKKTREDPQKRLKSSYKTIVQNMILNDPSTLYHYYEDAATHYTTLFMLSNYKSGNYLLATREQNGIPNGSGVFYSMQSLTILCRFMFHHGIVTECIIDAKEGEASRPVEILDVNDDGERWEGEIRNLLPNGHGQFFNTDNVCIYDGVMVNGRANGLGTGYYGDIGVKSYYGYWKNNRRHGCGVEYDRNGAFCRTGLWLDDSYVQMNTLPCDVSTPHLNASSYSQLVRVMYINDKSLHRDGVNTISNFPLLKALFLDSPSVGESEWRVSDMPMLEKVVAGIRHDGCWCNHYIQFVNCPRLREFWSIVDFSHGTVDLQPADSTVSRYAKERFDEPFEPRFVLGELEKYMKWKRRGTPEDKEELRYYRVLKSRYVYLFDPEYRSTVDVKQLEDMYDSGKEGGYCAQLSAGINQQTGMSITHSVDRHAEIIFAFEGYLKSKMCCVC